MEFMSTGRWSSKSGSICRMLEADSMGKGSFLNPEALGVVTASWALHMARSYTGYDLLSFGATPTDICRVFALRLS